MGLFDQLANSKPSSRPLAEKHDNVSKKVEKTKAPAKKRPRTESKEEDEANKKVNKPIVSIKDKLAMFKKKPIQ